MGTPLEVAESRGYDAIADCLRRSLAEASMLVVTG